MFSPDQKAQLSAKLDGGAVKQRAQAGRQLSYIEGWHAIAEANRIFGYDGWSRETVETTRIWEGERQTKNGPKPAASYTARVRVTVYAGERTLIREGTGAGSGFGQDAGEAHESAVKEAETDAMKRALMTFGNPFGLALYDKTQENVEHGAPTGRHSALRAPFNWESFHAEALRELAGKNVAQCRGWWGENKMTLGEMQKEAPVLWQKIKDFCATAEAA